MATVARLTKPSRSRGQETLNEWLPSHLDELPQTQQMVNDVLRLVSRNPSGILAETIFANQEQYQEEQTELLRDLWAVFYSQQVKANRMGPKKRFSLFVRSNLSDAVSGITGVTEEQLLADMGKTFDMYVKYFSTYTPSVPCTESTKFSLSCLRQRDIEVREFLRDNLGQLEKGTTKAVELARRRVQDLERCAGEEKDDELKRFFQEQYRREQQVLDEYNSSSNSDPEHLLNSFCQAIRYHPGDNPSSTVCSRVPVLPNTFYIGDIASDSQQFVFGFNFGEQNKLDDYIKYCPSRFRALTVPLPPGDKSCSEIVYWSPLLNKLYLYCAMRSPLDLPIRFLIPQFGYYTKYRVPVTFEQIFDNFVYVGFITLEFDDTRNTRHPSQMLIYFLFYDKQQSRFRTVHSQLTRFYVFDMFRSSYRLGTLFKFKSITYQELITLNSYFDLNCYYVPSQPYIVFFSKKVLTTPYLQRRGLVRTNIFFAPSSQFSSPRTIRQLINWPQVQDLKTMSARVKMMHNIHQIDWEIAYFKHLMPEYITKGIFPRFFAGEPISKFPTKLAQPLRKLTTAVMSLQAQKRSRRRSPRRTLYQQGGQNTNISIIEVAKEKGFTEKNVRNPNKNSFLKRFDIQEFDDNVASNFFFPFLQINFEYLLLFKSIKEANAFLSHLNPYEFISPQAFFTQRKKTVRNIKSGKYTKSYQVFELLDPEIQSFSIIKYIPQNQATFFESWEVLHNFPVLTENIHNILDMTSNETFLEATHYFQKKYHLGNLNQNLLFFEKYSSLDNIPKHLKRLHQYVPMKSDVWKEYFNESLMKRSGSFDLIRCAVSFGTDLKTYRYEELINTRLLFYQMLFATLHLNKNGNIVLVTRGILTDETAKVIMTFAKLFQETNFYFPEIRNPRKRSGTRVIYQRFKGVGDTEKTSLLSLFEKMYMEDETGVKYEEKDHEKYTKALDILPIPVSEFKEIFEFNTKLFVSKLEFMRKAVVLKKNENNTEKERIRPQQLVNSIIWAKKYDLDYYEFDPKTFENQFEKLILTDMYSYYEPVKFQFSPGRNHRLDNKEKIPNTFKRLTNIVDITDYQYEGRDITQYYKARRKVQYYRPLFKEIDLVNRVKRIVGNPSISQAWLKMYEMLNEFKLFDPNKEEIKTFHFCEAPGNFISALEYFCETRTKVKKVLWSAQTLHPDIADIGDNYGYIKRNPTRWDFGENKTGNITRVPNIKHYATLTKDVDLITSDCGLAKKATMDVMKVYFAQITAILVCLPETKNFVGKLVLFDSPAVFSAIYQVYLRFEHLFFYKNVINKQSFEFYMIGLNYKKKDEAQNNKMMEQLQNFEQEKFDDTYPTSFVRQMESIMTKLTNEYVFQTERWIYYMEHYEELETHKTREIYDYISQKNDEWLERVDLI